MPEELGISLGTETVVVEKKLSLIGFRYEGCNKEGEQTLYIEYNIGSAYKQIAISGYELYNFYINLWTDGRAIINKIAEVEAIDLSSVTLDNAEYQFVAGLPTEPVVEQPTE